MNIDIHTDNYFRTIGSLALKDEPHPAITSEGAIFDLMYQVAFRLGWLKTLLLTGGFHPWSQDIVRFFFKDSRYIFSVCQYLPSQLVAASTFTML